LNLKKLRLLQEKTKILSWPVVIFLVSLTVALAGVLWMLVTNLQENSVKMQQYKTASKDLATAGQFHMAETLMVNPLTEASKSRAGKHKKARDLYDQAAQAWGEQRYIDTIKLARESIKECEADFAKGNTYPDDNKTLSTGYALIGRAQYQIKDYRAALAALTQSIELNPGNPGTYAVRSGVYNNLGDIKRATADRVSEQKLEAGLDPTTRALSRFLGEGFQEE
jgi:tetratricopeptide (TPR) repeat protein